MGSAGKDEIYVTVSALEAGQLTLPERLFITDADPEKKATVPSLSFLIQHASQDGKSTKFVFDLGLKRDLTKYPPAQQAHIANRQPTILHPDCADSLRAGGLDPANDIDIVMLSHVHWDHEGTPDDFPNSQFVVGSGTLHLLKNGAPPHYPQEIFNADLLPRDRTSELPPVSKSSTTAAGKQTGHAWKPSVHVDTEQAKETLRRIGPLLRTPTPSLEGDNHVEVIVAHDGEWRKKNPAKFFPGTI
ncbi:hypothetical protein H2202_000478 [Exophiala xenobiotica]|nr:hypothetical protein H2202_000478 [Exophiala xenobiotica]